MYMYAMNIQNDVIGLVLRQNCKSKQVTDFIAWPSSMLVKYVSIDGIPQVFLSFRFVDLIVITVHDRFWNVGQANCILKYFENR
jgi:phosphate starvation-inducible membrane PsiE